MSFDVMCELCVYVYMCVSVCACVCVCVLVCVSVCVFLQSLQGGNEVGNPIVLNLHLRCRSGGDPICFLPIFHVLSKCVELKMHSHNRQRLIRIKQTFVNNNKWFVRQRGMQCNICNRPTNLHRRGRISVTYSQHTGTDTETQKHILFVCHHFGCFCCLKSKTHILNKRGIGVCGEVVRNWD